MKRSLSSSQVFHLRQTLDTGTVFHLQNVNISTNAVLLSRLTTLQSGFASMSINDTTAAADDIISAALTKAASTMDQMDDTSGIEYFYMAMTLLRTEDRISPRFMQLLELACKRDPASHLLQQILSLAQQRSEEMTVTATVSEMCVDIAKKRQHSPKSPRAGDDDRRSSRQWSESPIRGMRIGNEDKEDGGGSATDEEDEEDVTSGTEEDMQRRKTFQQIHDWFRLGLFLTSEQLAVIDDALHANVQHGDLRDKEKRRMQDSMVKNFNEQAPRPIRERSLCLLGPTLPSSVAMHTDRCGDGLIQQVHIVDWSQRRLQKILNDLMTARKKLAQRVFISDSTTPKYCTDEPSWAGDRTYDYTTSIFSLHHISAFDRVNVFRFVRQNSKILHVVMFDDDSTAMATATAAKIKTKTKTKQENPEQDEDEDVNANANANANKDIILNNQSETKQTSNEMETSATTMPLAWNDPQKFASLVDSFEMGMREASNAVSEHFEDEEKKEGRGDPPKNEQEAKERETRLSEMSQYARVLLAQYFMLAIADGPPHAPVLGSPRASSTPKSTRRSSFSGKRRSNILQPISLSQVVCEMEEEGLTILSSVKLFDHWYRPVYAIVAKAKSIESTATTVIELETENDLLRAKVQELSEALEKNKRDNKSWAVETSTSSGALKISSLGY